MASRVLNARGRFGAAALAPSLYNLAIIGGALVLGPVMGVGRLAIGVVVGAALAPRRSSCRPLIRRSASSSRSSIDLADTAGAPGAAR